MSDVKVIPISDAYRENWERIFGSHDQIEPIGVGVTLTVKDGVVVDCYRYRECGKAVKACA